MSDKLIYTTPQSVHKIMDNFGTTGFVNSPEGLYYCNGSTFVKFKKGEEVTAKKLGRNEKVK